MFMGNGTASKIEGKWKVIVKLTSGKDLVLSNVLHVPNITKNMISGPTLSNKEFKVVFELNKFVITKGGVYVGKGYLDEGLELLIVFGVKHVDVSFSISSLALKTGRYAALEGSDTTYWDNLEWAHDYFILEYSLTATEYGV
ncbi:hypothetical protein Tco_0399713 [Tanacetum coccineum]